LVDGEVNHFPFLFNRDQGGMGKKEGMRVIRFEKRREKRKEEKRR
jgi:hypothetical protein